MSPTHVQTARRDPLNTLAIGESRMFVRGGVERGDQRGRLLGFPTANIAIEAHSIAPPDGVYAGYVHLTTAVHPAAISVGRRPTFYESRGVRLLEAHLLDFDADIYGDVVTVEIIHRLRGQIRFDGAAALIRQLTEDVDRTAALMSPSPRTGRAPSRSGPNVTAG